jgi:selenide,water dikinase
VLRELTQFNDPRLLVGLDTTDDAAVYQLNSEQALIQTLDFFTPVVDDPYLFGQIAAANALSDVYAMGGTPLLALNIACFPTCLPVEVLQAILQGGADKVKEAGAILAGGHTVEDDEPKYGLSVTGIIHPAKIISNAGAKAGDLLLLTKPLGTGIALTALKADLAEAELVNSVQQSMATLNKDAAAVMVEVGVSACTDITGFGFLGHLYEMIVASKVSATVATCNIPVFPGVAALAQMGLIPGGAYRNRDYLVDNVTFTPGVKEEMADILFDPQTSGGLLISISAAKASVLIEKLAKYGVTTAAIVGEISGGAPGRIKVVQELNRS